jgi:hypothetical protein
MRRSYLVVGVGLAVLLLTQVAGLAITVVVNGTALPANPPALERGGRVLLPMRAVVEALQATVRWEEATQTASATDGVRMVRMTIGSHTAYLDDKAVTLDVPPQIINGYTYVPVRFPAEAFGAEVGWNAGTQTVMITHGMINQPVDGGGPPPMSGGPGAPIVYQPQNGDSMNPTRMEISIKTTPGVLQVIYTNVYRTDTGEFLSSVPGIRHMPNAQGMYSGAIATPRISIGADVPLRYEIHFRNGPNDGDPETVVTCYPAD